MSEAGDKGGEAPEPKRDDGAELRALEEELEGDRRKAAEALEGLRVQIDEAEARAERAEAERKRGESEARTAAAEWLRDRTKELRREIEREVRAGLRKDRRTGSKEDATELERLREELGSREKELEAREGELRREREARAQTLAAAEKRLAEIEAQVEAAEQLAQGSGGEKTPSTAPPASPAPQGTSRPAQDGLRGLRRRIRRRLG